MKVYISGKITGDPDYREKFDAVAREWTEKGHAVINPAMLPEGLTQRDYMRICLAMVDCADLMVLLPDWEESFGAQVEYAYARKMALPLRRHNAVSAPPPVEEAVWGPPIGYTEEPVEWVVCSRCGKPAPVFTDKYDYCPNCGASIKEGKE